MTNFQKLKHEARRAEQRSDWARAIDLYRLALDSDEEMTDLSLYNRIGDLHHRQGQTEQAVESYEQAVEQYAENGMHTSAIALCNKILRIAPDRAPVFRRLAGLHARAGLLVEGRANCLTYVRSSLEHGAAAQAHDAVEEFVSLTNDEEIRLQYATALKDAGQEEKALEQLSTVYAARRAEGGEAADLRARIVALGGEDLEDPSTEEDRTASEMEGPIRLADLVAHELADAGDDAGFDPSPPPPGPEPRRAGEDGLDAVRSLVGRFREEVRHALEGTDVSVRYDLGVEFMTIGLLDEAIEEFRAVVVAPGLMDAASARIAECLALQNVGESFAARCRLPHAVESSSERVPSEPETALAPPPLEEKTAAAGPESEMVPPASVDGEGSDGEDELQGHFFRARLAQYRIRRAEERHSTDHAGHLDLGTAYVEMDLHHEAVREFGVALLGPRPVSARAARAMRTLSAEPDTPPEIALQALALLSGSDHGSSVAELGAALAAAWGPDHPLAERLAELLRDQAESADELPSLESMFPGLAVPPAAAEPVSMPAPPAEPSLTGPAAAPESAPGPVEGQPAPGHEPESSAEPAVDSEVEARERRDESRDERQDEAARRMNGSPHRPSPSGIEAEDLAELDELLSQLDEAGLDGATTVEFEIEEANELAADGDPGGAADLLTSVLERLEGEHRTREALDVMRHLIALRPDDVMLHHHRAELAGMVNHREDLLSAYTELGDCLRRTHSAQSARAAYGRVLDIDPANSRAKEAIAEIDAAEIGGENAAEPGRDSTRSIAGVPGQEDYDALLHGLVDLENDAGLGRVLRVDDEDDDDESDPIASSHHDLGLAFRQMGMWNEAARELGSALEGVSDRLSVLETLGECLVKAERSNEAVELLQAELRADEDAGQVGPLYWLGIALQSGGDDEAARSVFARVEAANPGYRDAAGRLSELSL